MRRYKIVLLAFVLSFFHVACSRFTCEDGKGDFTISEKNISEFSDLKVSGNFEVILKQGEVYNCKIEAYENHLDIIEVRNSGRVLEISSKKCLKGKKRSRLFITAPQISFMRFSGAVDASSENQLAGKELSLKGSGSSKITLDLAIEDVNINISGSTDVKLVGVTKDLVFDISGSGSLDAIEFKATTARVDISGSADCKVNVKSSLKAIISGSGNILYSGNPSKIDTKISGSGKVSKVDS